MKPFATLEDLEVLWRKLAPEERERAEALLSVVSDSLRARGGPGGQGSERNGRQNRRLFLSVLKSVTVDIVARTLMTSTNQEPMTQMTQSAGGYSASGTFLVPGGGLFIKRSELARLGLRGQRYGGIDIYGSH